MKDMLLTHHIAFGEEPSLVPRPSITYKYEATSLVPGHPIMRTRPWPTWRSDQKAEGAELRRTLSSAV